MITIEATNVHQMFKISMECADHMTIRRPSRNGDVHRFDGPVALVYNEPTERVIFHPERDANPFFHLMECLWMMAGRNDVKWISRFNSNIASYSDDGKIFHGAYGHRWRSHFGFDQLEKIAEALTQNPDDRRAYLQIWDAQTDLGRDGKDFPCNVGIGFEVSAHGRLDMSVFNRSNDLVWGATGANAVHMSFLQEVMASWIRVPVGRYWQITKNMHVYDSVWEKYKPIIHKQEMDDWYEKGVVSPFPVVNEDIKIWFEDLSIFMDEGPIIGFRDPFFRKVVVPIYIAWQNYKSSEGDRIQRAREVLKNCAATDWRLACDEWLARRQK